VAQQAMVMACEGTATAYDLLPKLHSCRDGLTNDRNPCHTRLIDYAYSPGAGAHSGPVTPRTVDTGAGALGVFHLSDVTTEAAASNGGSLLHTLSAPNNIMASSANDFDSLSVSAALLNANLSQDWTGLAGTQPHTQGLASSLGTLLGADALRYQATTSKTSSSSSEHALARFAAAANAAAAATSCDAAHLLMPGVGG